MMNLKLSYIFLCLSLVISVLTWAQTESDFEAYKKAQIQKMSELKQSQQKGIDSLRKEQNRAFLELLKKEWEYVALSDGGHQYDQPKPPSPPSVSDEDFSKTKPVIELPDEKKKTTKPTAPEPDGGALNFEELIFFNASIISPDLSSWPEFETKEKIKQSQISDYWQSCIDLGFIDVLLTYFDDQQALFLLNDWATIMLIREIAENNFKHINSKTAFEWFILVQIGYDVRLMFDAHELHLAYPIKQTVYEKKYYVFDGTPYYLINSKPKERLYTYQGQFEGASKFPTFSKLTKTDLSTVKGKRTFEFSFSKKNYEIDIPFNYSAVGLYQTVPQLDLQYYFTERANVLFDETVTRVIKPYLDSINEVSDKVRFLHSMVMYSIPYQTDDEQFGYEKFCLPEEVLLYPYADCEDRTFLLNYLVKTLLDLRTIGLHFTGHMSMAIELPNPDQYSAVFSHNEKRYVYCDPTYFGADIGTLPNEYKGVKAEVIE